MRQKLWRDGQTFLLALCDSFTQAGGIPIDNYGRKQIETGHAVVLALGHSRYLFLDYEGNPEPDQSPPSWYNPSELILALSQSFSDAE